MTATTTKTTVLVTGAKAGIGRGLLAAYASRPNITAIAAIRDGPDSAAATALQTIPVGAGSKIVVVKYDASSRTAATELVSFITQQHSIIRLDIVIVNAGILKHCGPAAQVTPDEMLEHFQINTLAPLILYQATSTLLNASTMIPKFFIISSTLGSNTLMDNYPMPMVAYGTSKAAVNFIAGKLHREEEKIVVVPVQPGWVQTAMGEKAAEFIGLSKSDVPVTLAESVGGLLRVFDGATKQKYSGTLIDQNAQVVPW